MKVDVKEFVKDHKKAIERISLVTAGAGAVCLGKYVYENHIDPPKKAFLCDPMPLKDGNYEIIFGTISKHDNYRSLGSWGDSPDRIIELAQKWVDMMKEVKDTCGNN